MGFISKELLLALTVFSKEIGGLPMGGTYVDLFQLVVASYGLVFYMNLRRLWVLVGVLAGVVVVSMGLFATYDYPISTQFIRQAGAVSFIYVGIGSLLLRCSPGKLVTAYVNVCFFAALFGLIQFALSTRGINFLLKVPMRLDSVTFEPSHYAVAIAPCIYYCLRYWDRPGVKERAVVILTSLALTVSATAIGVFAISFSLAFFKRRGIAAVLLLTAVSPLLIAFADDVLPDVILSRFIYLKEIVERGSDSWDTENLTVLSYSTNFDVMKETIREGRIFGNGFCGHAIAYRRQYDHTTFSRHTWYGINAPGAHCLAIRIVSEFGIPGAIIMVILITKVVSNRRPDIWGMFLVVAIMARAIKIGSWIDYGLPVFLLAVFYLGGQAAIRRPKPIPSEENKVVEPA